MQMMSAIAAQMAIGACLLMATATAAGQPGNERTGKIEVGEPFPSITLPDLDGAPRSLAELRGQKVVLHVFASW